MKKTKLKSLVGLAVLTSVVLGACKKTPYKGYEEHEEGFYFQEFTNGSDTTHPKEGDVVTLNLSYKTDKDSLLFDSKTIGAPFMVRMMKPLYKGDIFAALFTMNLGDSTSFIMRADSFFTKIQQQPMPAFLDSTSMLFFNVKLNKIMPKVEADKEQARMMQEREKQMQEQMAMIEKMKAEEPGLITKYIKEKGIKEKPSATGVYYIETKRGTGDLIKEGQSVTVLYKGMFVDGTVFDASEKHDNKPFTLVLGQHQVVPGWEEGLAKMRKGGKATFVIPSSQAYGDGGGQFSPYTPTVFEVEVVDVK